MHYQTFDELIHELEKTHFPLSQVLVDELYALWQTIHDKQSTEGQQYLLLLVKFLIHGVNETKKELYRVLCHEVSPRLIVVDAEEKAQLLQIFGKKP